MRLLPAFALALCLGAQAHETGTNHVHGYFTPLEHTLALFNGITQFAGLRPFN